MNTRLTIKDLAGVLAKKTGRGDEVVERFLKELVTITRESVFTDRLMQVKGIGTFKIIQVDSRESVDVNTKERIVIPAHYKLSFSPDKEMREMVNKPFSFFESIEINDDTDFTSFEMPVEDEKDEDTDEMEETEEIEDVEGVEEIPIPVQLPEPPPPIIPPPIVEEPIPVKPTYIQPIIEEPVIEKEEPVEKPEVVYREERKTETKAETETNKVDYKIVETKELTKEIIETKEVPEEKVIKEKVEQSETNFLKENDMNEYDNNRRRERDSYSSTERSSNNNTLVAVLLAFVVILIIAFGTFLFMKRDVLFGSGVAQTETTTKQDPNHFTLPDDDLYSDGTGDGWETEEGETATNDRSATSSGNGDIIATIKTKRGDRLNLLALEYYGNKMFWVYIYEQNKSKIDNPDNIAVGLELDIPAKSVYNIDANDPASIKRASVLQTQIMSKYKPARRYSRRYYNRYQYTDPYMYSNPYNNNYSNQYNQYNQYSSPGNQYNSYQGTTDLNNTYQYSDPYQNSNQYNSNSQYNNNQYNNNDYDPFLY